MEFVTLNDGVKVPAIGFGVFMIPADGSTYEAVWCPECGAEVSLAMEQCPVCGHRL